MDARLIPYLAIANKGVVNIERPVVVKVLSQALADETIDFESLDKNLRAGLASAIVKELKRPQSELTAIVDDKMKEKLQQQIEKNKQKTNCRHELKCSYWGHT